MYRCLAIAGAALGLLTVAQAQPSRQFPAHALRGEIVVLAPPEITLNGEPARLSPGSRIRAQDNMLRLSAGMVGQKLRVHYTVDTLGLVHDVWILRPEEARVRPWPRTPDEARAWQFDPVSQTWSKP